MATKKVWILLATGFEETEAIGCWDALVRAGLNVELISTLPNSLEITGSHGLSLVAKRSIMDLHDDMADAILLPGGLPGATNLRDNKTVGDLILKHHEAHKIIGAICAAPIVLAYLGLLKGQKATVYPGFEKELREAECQNIPVVRSGNIITAQGPAYAFHFGISVIDALFSSEKAKEVAKGLLITEGY